MYLLILGIEIILALHAMLNENSLWAFWVQLFLQLATFGSAAPAYVLPPFIKLLSLINQIITSVDVSYLFKWSSSPSRDALFKPTHTGAKSQGLVWSQERRGPKAEAWRAHCAQARWVSIPEAAQGCLHPALSLTLLGEGSEWNAFPSEEDIC